MTAVIHCSTEEEYGSYVEELESNPDFMDLGRFDMIQDIYEELNGQGFSDGQIEQLSKNRYGNCLDILEYADGYHAFIGAR